VISLQLLEYAHEPLRRDRRVDLDVQRFAVEVVDDVERSEPSAAGQRVAHEIGRPHRVGLTRDVECDALTLRQPLPRRTPQIQMHRLVHAVDPFRVGAPAGAAKQLAALPEAAVRPIFDELRKRCDQLGITHRPVERRRIPRRAR
jgi:hypothetical protein